MKISFWDCTFSGSYLVLERLNHAGVQQLPENLFRNDNKKSPHRFPWKMSATWPEYWDCLKTVRPKFQRSCSRCDVEQFESHHLLQGLEISISMGSTRHFFWGNNRYLLHDLPVSYIFSRWVLTFPGFFGGLGMLQEYVGCNPLGSFLPVLFRTAPLSRTNPNLGENSA